VPGVGIDSLGDGSIVNYSLILGGGAVSLMRTGLRLARESPDTEGLRLR
jgi:hypothetical protein